MSATARARNSSNDGVLKTTTWGAWFALLALVTLLTAGTSLADSKKPKFSDDLDTARSGKQGATVDVIIQFNQTPTDAHHQKVQNKGVTLKTKLDFIKAAHYSVPVESLDALDDDPDVTYISLNRRVRGTLDHVVTAVNRDLPYASACLATGVGIAAVDSGISSNYPMTAARDK